MSRVCCAMRRLVRKILGVVIGLDTGRRLRRRAIRAGRRLFGPREHPSIPLAAPTMSSRVKILNLPDKHVFFGYYDVTPFSDDGSLILALTVQSKGRDRPRRAGIGFFHLRTAAFHPLGETAAWNWQQGCRLRWHPNANGLILYNDSEHGQGVCRVASAEDGRVERTYCMPIYDVDAAGTFGLSLDFARLHRYRPGYGYCSLTPNRLAEPAPDGNGIWTLDLRSGRTVLVCSLAELAACVSNPSVGAAFHYVNHLSFNPSGRRFLFFHLWVDSGGRRASRLFTSDIEGRRVRQLTRDGAVSHYCWRSDSEILVTWYREGVGVRYYVIPDSELPEPIPFDHETLVEDGHPGFSPDGRYLITDTYPDEVGDQHLILVSPDSGCRELGRYYAPFRFRGPERCDLHPRWDLAGRRVCFDAVRRRRRAIHVLDLPDLLGSGDGTDEAGLTDEGCRAEQ